MFRSRINLTKIVFAVLLALCLMTGGIAFLCSEVATPPSQMEQDVDQVDAALVGTCSMTLNFTVYGSPLSSGSKTLGCEITGTHSTTSTSFSFSSDTTALTQNILIRGTYKGDISIMSTNSTTIESRATTAESRATTVEQYEFPISFNNVSTFATGVSNGGYAKKDNSAVLLTNLSSLSISTTTTTLSSVTRDISIYHETRFLVNFNGGHAPSGWVDKNTSAASQMPTTLWFKTYTNTGTTAFPVATWLYLNNPALTDQANATLGDNVALKPARSGYTFNGYWTAASGGTQIVDKDGNWKITRDSAECYPRTVYAQWQLADIKTCKVTYNPNGGSISSSYATDYVVYGGTYAGKANIYRPEFSNLSMTNSDCKFSFSSDNTSGTGTLYYNFFTKKEAISCVAGAPYTIAIYVSSFSGDSFVITTTSPNDETNGDVATSGSGVTVTGTGQYTTTFTAKSDISAAVNGLRSYVYINSGKKSSATFYIALFPGHLIGNPTNTTWETDVAATGTSLPTPTRTGYTFDGWWTAASGGTQVTATTEVTNSSDHTLYAHWTANSYTVTLNNQSATTAGTTQVYYTFATNTYYSNSSHSSTLSAISVPKRTGYTFGGYYTSTGGSGTQYITAAGAFTNNLYNQAGNRTLYAKWTANTYNVSFNVNHDSINTNLFSFNKIASGTTSNGATFTYNSTTGILTVNGTVTGATEIFRIPVTFATGDAYTLKITCLDVSKVSGTNGTPFFTYDFYDASGSRFMYNDVSAKNGSATKTVTSDYNGVNGSIAMRLYNTYSPVYSNAQFKIKIEKSSSATEYSPDTRSVTYDSTYGTLPTVTRTGYGFEGWRLGSANGVVMYSSTVFTSTADVILYAHWGAMHCWVTLDDQGATTAAAPTKIRYLYETPSYYDASGSDVISKITCPTKIGYTFGGYYTGTNGGGTQYISANGSFVNNLYKVWWGDTQNTTLYAKWTPNSYQFKANPNGGTYSGSTSTANVTQNYNTSYSLATPTRTGYNFNGWSIGQNLIGSTTAFNGSSTVINLGRTYMYSDAICVSVRASMTDWSTYANNTMRIISCTEGGGWNFEPNGGYIQFACFDAGENTYKVAKSSKKWSDLSSGYHTFQGVFNGSHAMCYLDGELIAVSARYTGGIGYHASNAIFVGAEAGSNATTPAGSYFNGTIDYVTITNSAVGTKPTSYTIPAYNSAATALWTVNSYALIQNGNTGTFAAAKFGSGQYFTTDVNMDWGMDFSAAGSFMIPAQGARYLVLGSYPSSSLQVEVNANNYIRLHVDMSTTIDLPGTKALSANTWYTYHVAYNCTTRLITLKVFSATGSVVDTVTATAPSNAVAAANAFRLGTVDYRGSSSPFGSITLGQLSLVSGLTKKTYVPISATQWKETIGNTTSTTTGTTTFTTATVCALPRTYGEKYSTLAIPTKTGYSHKWFTASTNGTEVNPDKVTMGAANATIYAQWTKNSYTLTANCNGGSIDFPPTGWTANGTTPYTSVAYNSTYGDLPTPSRLGYIFAGWFTAASGGTEVSSGTQMTSTSGATIYAHWVESWIKYMPSSYYTENISEVLEKRTNSLDLTDEYYVVDTAEKLAYLAYLENFTEVVTSNLRVRLTADIDLSAHYWDPIAHDSEAMWVYFDGQTYDISNMRTYYGTTNIYRNYSIADRIGLFGGAECMEIRNVTLNNIEIPDGINVGGIVGSGVDVTITNCRVSGECNGEFVGGIAGFLTGGEDSCYVSNCENYAKLNAEDYIAGGIVGYGMMRVYVSDCVNYGEINATGDCYAGGIIGTCDVNIFVSNCVNAGNVGINGSAGGIAGCVTGNISITNCINQGQIKGAYGVGGIIGDVYVDGDTTITNCVSTGKIIHNYTDNIGGIVGATYDENGGEIYISNCYVECEIQMASGESTDVGSFIGQTDVKATITYCGANIKLTNAATNFYVYGNTTARIICNDSYVLINNGGSQINRITTSLTSSMDGHFGMIDQIHNGLPIPLGIYHVSQYGTTEGIANYLTTTKGCTTA